MATERELKTMQENRLFDLLIVYHANEKERMALLEMQIAREQSGMTKEEIASVKERVASVQKAGE